MVLNLGLPFSYPLALQLEYINQILSLSVVKLPVEDTSRPQVVKLWLRLVSASHFFRKQTDAKPAKFL